MTPEEKERNKKRLEEKRRNPDLFEGDTDYYYTMVTLRDLFAGFALAGLLANPQILMEPKDAADTAGEHADALLKERAK